MGIKEKDFSSKVKLAITISNYGAAMHIGGDVEVSTHIVEIEDERLARLIEPRQYSTISISIVEDNQP